MSTGKKIQQGWPQLKLVGAYLALRDGIGCIVLIDGREYQMDEISIESSDLEIRVNSE